MLNIRYSIMLGCLIKMSENNFRDEVLSPEKKIEDSIINFQFGLDLIKNKMMNGYEQIKEEVKKTLNENMDVVIEKRTFPDFDESNFPLIIISSGEHDPVLHILAQRK